MDSWDDADEQELPGALVTEYLERESGTRALLDDLERLVLEGEHERARERTRAFAENSPGVFFAVALSLTGSKQFFGDVEAQLDVSAADELRDLAETYPALQEPFNVVRTEQSHDRYNPVTGLSTTTTYHGEEEVPLIRYAMQSGDLSLLEATESPQEVLQVAIYLVQATNDALGASLEQDHSVNTQELSGLIDRREELESELDQLRAQIDELRRRPVGDE
ncbi:hypothetical protein [Halapricum desulfuricans]|uniref:Uncharacterized protein n=1 Tax=Halapricum desulfuricans TaxID=2841257 RepID=A0A897NJE3_9EURY|nr:hypothetical protein [Halapricum desulfuricans]QSG08613.1 Uncharacterized protein HSR122_1215 [Halapricum desulfuricans]QSG11565.1 Uncharacterized protein HSBGL_1141 [Halapricum desulfuricans]